MTHNNTHHIFTGTNALFDYLTPGSCGPLPLVELPQSLNPFITDKVRIFVKLMNQLPLTNIKSIPARNMLDSLSLEQTNSTKNLVEYSSGNTVLSLTILAQYFGIPHTHALITADVPEYKKRILQLVGTQLLITDGPSSPGVHDTVGGIWNAQQLGKKKGWHNFNQYTTLANPNGSEKYIAAELWKQLGKNISVIVNSIGTSGTIYGLGRFFKKKNKKIQVVGISIKDGSSIPGPRGEIAVKKLAFPWQQVVDTEIPITTKPAYALALKMIRLGLFVGPSTGMQLAGIYSYIKSRKQAGNLDKLRNTTGTIDIVFLAGDTMYPYVEDFFKHLPPESFPQVKDLSL
jgi:cysteine synthase